MDKIQKIQKKFQNIGKYKGNELLLKRQKALGFIDEYRKKKVIILGMDFYKVKEGVIFSLIMVLKYLRKADGIESYN